MMREREGLDHGGRLVAAMARFPEAPLPWLDLSTGINPVPYPIPALEPALFARLPEPEALAALNQAAASAYGLGDPAAVVAASGTQALIGLLPRLFPPSRVAVLGPTYAEHARAWHAGGHAVHEIASLAARRNAEILVLCNPNNPDGRVIDPAELRGLAGRGVWLVVDEAFADFAAPAVSLAPEMPAERIVVLRSFGKAFGLAGLRLGFALAPPALAARLRAALGPWPVSGPALAIGRAALGDRAWREAARLRLTGDGARLDSLLEASGLRLRGGTALFRLAESADSGAVFERLGEAGILVRRFADHPRWLRFGLPSTQEAFARLRQTLGMVKKSADAGWTKNCSHPAAPAARETDEEP